MGEEYSLDDFKLDSEENEERYNDPMRDDGEEIPTIKMNDAPIPGICAKIKAFFDSDSSALEKPTKDFLSIIDSYSCWLLEGGNPGKITPWKEWRRRIVPAIETFCKSLKNVGFAGELSLPDHEGFAPRDAAETARWIIKDINAVFFRFDPSYIWAQRANEYVRGWMSGNGANFGFYKLKEAIEKKFEEHRPRSSASRSFNPHSIGLELQKLHDEFEDFKEKFTEAEPNKKFALTESAPRSDTPATAKPPDEVQLAQKALEQNNVEALKKLESLVKIMQGTRNITGTYSQRWDNFMEAHLKRYIKMHDEVKKIMTDLKI